MSLREINEKMKIINKKTKNLIANYLMTVINNKNEINRNIKPEDLNIVLSSGNGSKKRIFYKLSIVNPLFDPNTYSKGNLDKFQELKNLIEPLDEEGINPKKDFEEINFDFVPKLEKGLKFNLSSFDFQKFKEREEIESFDKNFFNEPNDKSLFCIYTSKLNGQSHKFKKLIEFCDTLCNNKNEFLKTFRKVLIIFEVKSKDVIEEEYLNNIPYELRYISEEEDGYEHIQMLFLIKGENENNANDIFSDNNFSKTFYFILDPENYITEIKNFYSPKRVVEELISKKRNKADDNGNENIYNQKVDAFFEFYTFLKNLKDLKYYFYINYYFDLILQYQENEDGPKLMIKDFILSRFSGEVRSKEYEKLQRILSIFTPDYKELTKLETVDIDVDFSDMTCVKCSKTIKDDEELFYCYICKEKYCYNCVKSNYHSSTGKDKFIDPKHNLIFFKTRDKKNFLEIDKYKLGRNTFAEANEEDLGRFKSVQCDGCALQFATSPRYICLSCNPGLRKNEGFNDYCQNCIEHMMKDDEAGRNLQRSRSNVYNTSISLLKDEKYYLSHSHKDHIYIMIALANNNEDNPYTDY